jgi:hypothetical protein
MTTPQQTQAQIDAAMAALAGKSEAAVQAFVGELWRRVVEETPVDTPEFKSPRSPAPGVARGNWNFAVGTPDFSTFSTGRVNTGNAPPLPKVTMAGNVMYLTNTTPYIQVLEYGGYPIPVKYGSWNYQTKRHVVKTQHTGWTQKTPRGWVRLAAAAAQNLVQGIVTRISQTPALAGRWGGQYDQPQVPRF